MRDRDTEGETVQECHEHLSRIAAVLTDQMASMKLLRHANSGYLAQVADEDSQWYDEVGALAHDFTVKAIEETQHAIDQANHYKAVWLTRLEIAHTEEEDDE